MRPGIAVGMRGTRRPGAMGKARPEQTSRETREIVEWRREMAADTDIRLAHEGRRILRGDYLVESIEP